MSRTIVSIISEQIIPNYLFIKEKFQPGDKLIFISSKKFETRHERIVNTLAWNLLEVKNIVLPNEGDEENWTSMNNVICTELSDKEEYIVNLTGGTKYMALAIERLFSRYNIFTGSTDIFKLLKVLVSIVPIIPAVNPILYILYPS